MTSTAGGGKGGPVGGRKRVLRDSLTDPPRSEITNPGSPQAGFNWNQAGTLDPINHIWHAVLTGGDPGNDHPLHDNSHINTIRRHLRVYPNGVVQCGELNCRANAVHGAHVYTIHDTPDRNANLCWLLPTCAIHNRAPQNNFWNYPMATDYDTWKAGPGARRVPIHGPPLMAGGGWGGHTLPWLASPPDGPDFYGHPTIRPNVGFRLGVGGLPRANTIEDIKYGMPIKANTILVPHNINRVIVRPHEQFAGSYNL